MKKILLFVVIAVVVIFGGLYLLGSSDDDLGNQTGSNGGGVATYSPTETVTMYMRATLGTIPGALVDYTLAETLLSGNMGAQFNEHEFVPMSYGIQQGPEKVEFIDENASGGTATVRVWGYWGDEVGKDWTFTLELEGDQWLITDLTGVDPTDQQ